MITIEKYLQRMIKLYAGRIYWSGLQEFLATDSSQAET